MQPELDNNGTSQKSLFQGNRIQQRHEAKELLHALFLLLVHLIGHCNVAMQVKMITCWRFQSHAEQIFSGTHVALVLEEQGPHG